MNKSTKIMFLIGLICNILEIITLVVGIFALAIAVGASDEIFARLPASVQDQFQNAAGFKQWCVTGCVSCVFAVLISVAVLVLSRYAKKAQEKGNTTIVWPILMIVLGALNNIFYLVAGILCLVENNQKQQPAQAPAQTQPAPQPVIEEKPVEEKPAAKPRTRSTAVAKKPATRAKKEEK